MGVKWKKKMKIIEKLLAVAGKDGFQLDSTIDTGYIFQGIKNREITV